MPSAPRSPPSRRAGDGCLLRGEGASPEGGRGAWGVGEYARYREGNVGGDWWAGARIAWAPALSLLCSSHVVSVPLPLHILRVRALHADLRNVGVRCLSNVRLQPRSPARSTARGVTHQEGLTHGSVAQSDRRSSIRERGGETSSAPDIVSVNSDERLVITRRGKPRSEEASEKVSQQKRQLALD